jgi:hypothetical protein
MGIWKFLPSHIYWAEIVARKNQEFRLFFWPLSNGGDEQPYDGFGQGLGGSKAQNLLFLHSLGTECTENTQ